jgi:hypothetical protein
MTSLASRQVLASLEPSQDKGKGKASSGPTKRNQVGGYSVRDRSTFDGASWRGRTIPKLLPRGKALPSGEAEHSLAEYDIELSVVECQPCFKVVQCMEHALQVQGPVARMFLLHHKLHLLQTREALVVDGV